MKINQPPFEAQHSTHCAKNSPEELIAARAQAARWRFQQGFEEVHMRERWAHGVRWDLFYDIDSETFH